MTSHDQQPPEPQPTVFPFPFGSTFSDESSASSAPEQSAETEKE